MVRMVSYPLDFGRSVMKSMETYWKGPSSAGVSKWWVKRDVWKTGCIVHETGRSSLNTMRNIAFSILKGPYHFGFSLDP